MTGVQTCALPIFQGYHKSIILKIINYFSFVFFGCLIGLFIGKKFDKIFIYQTGPLTVALPAILIKKLYKTKITIWTQDLWPDTVYGYGFKKTRLLSFILEKLVGFVYRNCSTILVSCEGFIPKINQYVIDKNIIWIPNWSLLEYKPTKKVKLRGEFNFTFAGNIGKVQNLENVILGFEIFVKDYPSSYLNIIGDGSHLNELRDLVLEKKIRNIEFLGRKPLVEMSNYFQASDVLIISLIDSPIFELTIPSKFQAYLATEKPIMGTINGEVSTLIENNKIGFSANPNDIKEIGITFSIFKKLSEQQIQDISLNAKKLLEDSFSRPYLIKKITRIFWDTY